MASSTHGMDHGTVADSGNAQHTKLSHLLVPATPDRTKDATIPCYGHDGNHMFLKRRGTTDRGKTYEDYIVSEVILNLMTHETVKDFQIWSNDDSLGAFDDVVINIKTTQGTEKYALQLKHVAEKNKSLTVGSLLNEKGNFSIKKYFDCFSQLEPEFRDYDYILWTNLKFKFDKAFTVKNNEVELRVVKCQASPLLNSSKEQNCCFQFQLVKSLTLSQQQSEEFEKFLQSFFLYTNQIHVDHLESQVVKNFSEAFGCEDLVSRCFLDFINKWSIREGKKEKLYKELAHQVIALTLLHGYVHPFSFTGVTNENSKLLLEAMSKYDATFLNEKSLQKVEKLLSSDSKTEIDWKEVNQVCQKYPISYSSVNKIQDLDDRDFSKLLWAMNKYPILVKDTPVTRAAIKLCKDKKYVLIGTNLNGTQLDNISIFKNLDDLKKHQDVFNRLVKQFKCSVPGEHTLQQLIGEDGDYVNITTDDLLEMIDAPYKIIQRSELLPDIHIARSLPKTIIDVTFLKSFDDKRSLVFVCNVKEKDQRKKLFQEFILISVGEDNEYTKIDAMESGPSEKKLYISKEECSQKIYEDFCEKNQRISVIHYLRYENETLEWLKSKGSISELQQHRSYATGTEAIHFPNSLNVLTADPGFGKSVFLNHLKNASSSRCWTEIISPKDIHDLYKSTQDPKNLSEFENFILETKCSELTSFQKIILKQMMKKGEMFLLWDALDEISNEERQFAEELILTLSQKMKGQFITSRCHLGKTLEDKFGVLAKTLAPFDSGRQKEYIRERFKDQPWTDSKEICKAVIKTIFQASYQDILGIPLQIFMLTELFCKDIDKYLKVFRNLVLLTDLYHYFVEEKLNIYLKEKCDLHLDSFRQQNMSQKLKTLQITNYQKAALKTIFGDEFLNHLGLECGDFLEEVITVGDASGLITNVAKDNMQPEFVHNSYAEYFAATHLVNNITKMPNLEDFFFDRKYTNVRLFFDMLSAKNCPAHIAVLCKNLKHLTGCEDGLNRKDLVGRNPLQLLCSWGERYPLLKVQEEVTKWLPTIYKINDNIEFSVKRESQEHKEMLEFLLTNCDHTEKVGLLGLDSISYAEKCECLYAVAAIENRTKTSYFNSKSDSFVCNILYYAAGFGYDFAIDLFDNIKYVENTSGESLLHVAAAYNRMSWINKLLSQGNYKCYIDGKNRGRRETALHLATRNGHVEVVRALIEAGADPDSTDEDGVTALLPASCFNHVEMVRLLLEGGASVNVDTVGYTPLYFACNNGHVAVAEALLQNGANANMVDKEGGTPLIIACQNGHASIVKTLLLNGAKVNRAVRKGITPLFMACQNGHLEVATVLLDNGANVNAADNHGFTPLFIACQGGHIPIVELLLSKGANVDVADNKGGSPLLIACENGHVSVVEILCENDAKVDATLEDGVTPLYVTCQNGHTRVAEVLLRNGANVDLANKNGATPLFVACQNGHVSVAEMLLKKGAAVDLSSKDGSTPLFIACAKRHVPVAEVLIRNGANVDAAEKNCFTPLLIACANEDVSIVDVLLKNDADVDMADQDGFTPLHEVCLRGHVSIVKMLLEKGANIYTANKSGVSPLQMAASRGHGKIVKILLTGLIEDSD